MAQTTTAKTTSVGQVYVNIAGAGYIDISGSTNSLDSVTIELANGASGTLDGNEKVITAGRQNPQTITVNCLYTEGATEALRKAMASIKAGDICLVKWVPIGAGGKYFTTSVGSVITRVALPEANAENGEPLMFSFDVFTGGIETDIT